MTIAAAYYALYAAAFVRGTLPAGARRELWEYPLEALTDLELAALIDIGLAQGLSLHRFKRTMVLPRVAKVLGMLAGLAPASLLDIGSGRGTFLWPLLDAQPALPVTTCDREPFRAAQLQAVHAGGVARLTAVEMDACALAFPAGAFEVVTALEVLEHIPAWEAACAELVRVARRAVILSVPSKPDDNPEHLHLLPPDQLEACLLAAGARRVLRDGVPNHGILMALVDHDNAQ